MASKRTRNRKAWLCMDCGVDTGKIKEHYFVNISLWYLLVGSDRGMLCIGCLEERLGRKLTPSDFTNSHINNPKLYEKSARLLERMSRG